MQFQDNLTFLSVNFHTGSVFQIPFGTGSKDVVIEAVVKIENGDYFEDFICYYYNDGATKNSGIQIDTYRSTQSKYKFDDIGTFYHLTHPNSPLDTRFITGSL